MATFLIKTEPETYSWDDLVREKGAVWDGITNAAALKHLRSMKKGDDLFIYHTGDERRIVGLASVASQPRADPKDKSGKLAVIDIKPAKAVPKPVTLAEIKADPRFAEFALVKQGRLSVVPVPADLEKALRKLAGL